MWWQPSTTTFLRVAGFEEFPIMSPRWDTVAGDTYGRGLGREILPDTKMLYKMTKDYLLALDAKNNPTLVAPAGMKREFITTIPGGINYDSSAANQGLRPLHQNAIDLRDLAGQIGATQAAIQQGLFNQLFLMLANINDSTQRTATEIAARQEEKIVMLGPVLENLHTEFLDPVIKRTFNILSRTEQLPPPPEDIGDLEIEYVSILAQAQKSLGVVPLEQTVAFAGNLAGVKPDILDNIDFDQVMQHYGDFVGVPPDSMNPPEEVVQTRQARQQQEQMAQAAQMAESAAGSAKLLSEADLGGNNALAALTGGLGGLGGA